MKKLRRFFATLLSLFILASFFSLPAQAVYFGSGDNLNLPKDKKINETSIVGGNSLTIDSDVNGDLFCAGKNIIINGNIKGDVLCAGLSITINGNVDGNIRAVGQLIEINGIVAKNVTSASQSLTISKFASIKGDLFYGVQNVDLRGALGRDMLGAGEQINISGSLLRNAKVAGRKIFLVDPAKINGDFEYYLDTEGVASISSKNVTGSIVKHVSQKPTAEARFEASKKSFTVFSKVYGVLTSLVLGFFLLYYLKGSLENRNRTIISKPFVTGLIGFAVLILSPLAFIILLMTVIGIPLAFVLLLTYLLSLVTASIYPTIVLGQWFLKTIKQKSENLGWSLVAGALLMSFLVSVPVFGFIAGFVALCLGLGAIFTSYFPRK